MATLPTTGPLSLDDIGTFFGVPHPVSMAALYKGGAHVPAFGPGAREPLTGEQYHFDHPFTYWYVTPTQFHLRWNDVDFGYMPGGIGTLQFESGGWTYYRGTQQASGYYAIYRVQTGSPRPINPSVPTSGTISIQNFYGAEKP